MRNPRLRFIYHQEEETGTPHTTKGSAMMTLSYFFHSSRYFAVSFFLHFYRSFRTIVNEHGGSSSPHANSLKNFQRLTRSNHKNFPQILQKILSKIIKGVSPFSICRSLRERISNGPESNKGGGREEQKETKNKPKTKKEKETRTTIQEMKVRKEAVKGA